MISSATIAGYSLEEIIAKMLADNGYRLILSAAHDQERLVDGKHGLLVKGRGADHQADGLGDLLMPVPFSHPVRLFAEAKCRVASTGIEVVRNGYGVVSDVNQFQPASTRGPVWGRHGFHYRYSLFSTSGFTPMAQRFALAHQISLIDLSGSTFAGLRRAVEQFAVAVRELCLRAGLTSFPVGQMRAALRLALGTGGVEVPDNGEESRRLVAELDPSTSEFAHMPSDPLLDLASTLADEALGDMVLGFPVGPLVLVFRPDDGDAFRSWVARAPNRVSAQVRSTSAEPDGDWLLLVDGTQEASSVVLRFSTPDVITDWLFSSVRRLDARWSELQSGLLSSIVIYQAGRSITLELDLDPEEEGPQTATIEERMARRRRERLEPRFRAGFDDLWPRWTEETALYLLDALLLEDPGRATVLLAALNSAEGWVSRDDVYTLMGYLPNRSLRGFTKPYNRVRDVLVMQNRLPEQLPAPLVAEYPPRGGWTLGFRLDQGLARALRSALGRNADGEDEE